MKKVIIVLGFISAIIATILSASSYYNFATAPIVIAFACGIVVLFLSKKEKVKTKPIQYIFLLVIISLSLTIYKNVIIPVEELESEQIEISADDNEEDAVDNADIITKKNRLN
ncbi:hypothetical protein [uncultured Winogradskyella sp.]|uniref:hypothetical protein n=1 Tax=Winogradskyella sp. 4-2091 TaxID=3381659 RepID=UPI0026068B15|nr:hypothetical protein [uncultured Winogradskyella sp.]